jgi:hypothetical protein
MLEEALRLASQLKEAKVNYEIYIGIDKVFILII